MGSRKEFQAPAGAGEAPQEVVPEPVEAPQIVADMDTMTIAGVTFGEYCDQVKDELVRRDSQRMQDAIEHKAIVDAQAATIQRMAETIKDLNTDLAVARVVAQQAVGMPKGLIRLPNGGLQLAVTLDVDEAVPLLSWADCADEDPETYIAKTLKDALVAVTSS